MDKTANSIPISDNQAIALWNPTAAALWSLVFTPAFGAWLHMRNWERLGQPDKARQARYWFAGMLLIAVASYAVGAAGALLRRDDLSVPWWASLALVGAWGAGSAYQQIKHVDDHHGESYARRSWAAPILIGVAATCAMPFAAAGVLTAFWVATA
ncbi:hypothetical protein [Massilia varians]|uniref:hypothetical protein n=1 Tax=Massilia varians TaxID=457921 RepID=UPI00255465E5|nr:hypothetical protein [Massilia varians]MDK6077476.1 hypothetical protein [Massilia varians]